MEEQQDSQTTINTEFFDKLWPLILEDNICDIKSKNTSEYFLPKRKFDHLWAHNLLAKETFGDYRKPIDFSCRSDDQAEELPGTSTNLTEEVIQQPFRTPSQPIQPLDQQLAAINCDVQLRKKLAFDFANRSFPWYIQKPSYDYDVVLTDDMKNEFKKPFEYQIIYNVHLFECHLMIIDMAVDVQLKDLERWQKFSNYVAIVVVVHSPDTFRQLKAFNRIFRPVFMEEILENTWHDELNRALRIGLDHGKELRLYDNDGERVVFVFCTNRGICTCDNFKIVKRK